MDGLGSNAHGNQPTYSKCILGSLRQHEISFLSTEVCAVASPNIFLLSPFHDGRTLIHRVLFGGRSVPSACLLYIKWTIQEMKCLKVKTEKAFRHINAMKNAMTVRHTNILDGVRKVQFDSLGARGQPNSFVWVNCSRPS